MSIESDLVNTGMWDGQAKAISTAIVASNIQSQLSTAQLANLTTQSITALVTTDYTAMTTTTVAALNAQALSVNTIVTAIKALTKEA